MKRNAMEQLILWGNEATGKSFFLYGMTGVGKTSLALEYAKMFYEGSLYINFQNDKTLRNSFLSLNAETEDDFLLFFSVYFHIPKEWLPGILIIFDDFYTNEALCGQLQKLVQKNSHYRLLFISEKSPTAAFTGYCKSQLLTALEFDEYLSAIGSEWYTEIIRGHFQTNKRIPEIVHNEMLNLFRDYMRVGGMPGAINEYLRTESFDNIPMQHRLTEGLQHQALRYVPEGLAIRMRQILDCFPEQLQKENKKFQYSLIRKGATHAMYQDALDELLSMQFIRQIEKAELSVQGEGYQFVKKTNQYRLYAPDLGMLASILGSGRAFYNTMENLPDAETKIRSRAEFSELTAEEEPEDSTNPVLDHLLIENYLLQILSARKYEYAFWESGSMSKVDFMIKTEEGIVPFEIKLQDNSRSKSISVFRNRYHVPYVYKISSQNFDLSGPVRTIPYYALFCL